MEKRLQLTLADRKPGSYLRGDAAGDILHTFFRYKEFSITFAKASGAPAKVTDLLVNEMLAQGLITPAQKQAYEERLCREFTPVAPYDGWYIEQMYAHVCQVRGQELGVDALEAAFTAKAYRGIAFDPAQGIDQRAQKDALLQGHSALIFVLCQPELTDLMRADMKKALTQGKAVYLLASEQSGGDLPTGQLLENTLGSLENVHILPVEAKGVAWDEDLQQQIQSRDAAMLFYGEEGLLHCRQLLIDAVVSCIPTGYYPQALTNQLGSSRACVVYIPGGYDITPWVRLTQKTRVSYWQLAQLHKAYGAGVYTMTPDELYRHYPAYFVNIYENGKTLAPSPIRVSVQGTEDVLSQFDESREAAIAQYLNSFENIQYTSCYFDENMESRPICYDPKQKQPGVLVQSVRVKKARGAGVIRCPKGVTPRQMFADLGLEGTGIVSNFLFFMTPRLGVLYNDLRKDRPYEQADAAAGHLDYMLCHQDGKRVETFPLFRKTCIAMKADGSFFFFNFRLGGGEITLGDQTLRWKATDVDTDSAAPVRVYTPYYSVGDSDADRMTYCNAVGQGSVNLVILQDRLCCIRKGDVLLPSAGVVVSLDAAVGQKVLDALSPPALEDGYYDTEGVPLTITLDPPDTISAQEWEQVEWAYGGGLSLILEGKALCDQENMLPWFENEGWMSPLSRQTQESSLHTLAKHPRTAIGTTADGDLVILVFSGRTWRSTGADYVQMCRIARRLYPDIRCLMNVDGGGSAMLGMVDGGSFMELSCPSTSSGSCVGMVRPINTVFYIPAKGKEN